MVFEESARHLKSGKATLNLFTVEQVDNVVQQDDIRNVDMNELFAIWHKGGDKK